MRRTGQMRRRPFRAGPVKGLVGGGGLIIKSRQIVQVAVVAGTAATSTITPVDLSKAAVHIIGGAGITWSGPAISYINAYLSDESTVTWQTNYENINAGNNLAMVYEFENVKSLQTIHHVVLSGTSTNDETINAVNKDKCHFYPGTLVWGEDDNMSIGGPFVYNSVTSRIYANSLSGQCDFYGTIVESR